MRRAVIAGNWKMNHLISDTKLMLEALKGLVSNRNDVEVIIAPTFLSLGAAKEVISGSGIKLASQNVYCEEEGAFTGEIGPKMLLDAGCDYAIIGHSERRQYFHETDDLINKKIKKSIDSGLKVIFCIGETLEERESAKTFNVIKTQLSGGLKGVSSTELDNLIIAYEPVWAIGTGKTATAEQAEEVHAFIRRELSENYSSDVSEKMIIQYGGSVKAENIKSLMAKENIDGALVGGASLKAESFAAIVNFKDGE